MQPGTKYRVPQQGESDSMKIMYLNGALTGQTMELSPAGVTIGRESDNTIQLPMGASRATMRKSNATPRGTG